MTSEEDEAAWKEWQAWVYGPPSDAPGSTLPSTAKGSRSAAEAARVGDEGAAVMALMAGQSTGG